MNQRKPINITMCEKIVRRRDEEGEFLKAENWFMMQ